MAKSSGTKGYQYEEILRAYFLRAGLFVLRGVPFQFAGSDLTDIDLWLYERPNGATRRIQICDIKYKQRPKAVERVFWTRGLAEALGVDGAYVATTDKRPGIHTIGEKVGIVVLDGTDLARIAGSESVLFEDRVSDENLSQFLKDADEEVKSKTLQAEKAELLSVVAQDFGASSLVQALGSFQRVTNYILSARPDSDQVIGAGRLMYLSAAIVCESLDFVSAEAAFKSVDDRRRRMLEAVRFGRLGTANGEHALQMAIGLIERYGQGGAAQAQVIKASLDKDLAKIPAEIIADQAIRLSKGSGLFNIGREFEMACYLQTLPTFDELSKPAKGMLGSLLDFAGIDRERLANSWAAKGSGPTAHELATEDAAKAEGQLGLFGEGTP